MKLIKVSAGILNQKPMDWEGNKKNIIEAIKEAKRNNATIILLPEMSITGYGCEDAFLSPGLHKLALETLVDILPHTKNSIVSVGLPIMYKNAVFSCACLIVDTKIKGFIAKQNLAGDGIHYEPRWFKPWPSGILSHININGEKYPIGDIVFNIGGIKIGFEICEDAWVANRPGSIQALEGVDIILNPSASHFAFEKLKTRERFVIEGSRAFNVSYIYSNLVGNEAGRIIYDGGALIATAGKLIARGERFTFKDYSLTYAVINISKTRTMQARISSFRPKIEADNDLYIPFEYPKIDYDTTEIKSQFSWENSEYLKEEEFTRSITLGIFDYLRKSYSKGFVVSLSGGADSTATVVLIALMVHLGIKDLGLKGFLKKLKHIDSIQNKKNAKDIIKELLLTVYQGTRNSSDTTKNAAEKISESVGAKFYNLNIDNLVEAYKTLIENTINETLSWEKHDLALQNIQARVRSPGIWMLANLKNFLLLSTSNRSEAAVGYATMDGDTSGGLNIIGGIDKAFLRKWLVWMEKLGPSELFNIPELILVNRQQPTAELRPKSENQTDEADLMPYEVLDAIEKSAIRDKLMPLEVFIIIKAKFNKIYTEKQLALWVRKFFILWSTNQWKRERYAPSFHLDDENLDPKTWCRFPILSGGFKKELKALEVFIN